MATLEKIRSKGVLLLIVVGLAMLVFIIGDFVSSGSTYFKFNSENVAVVNGDKIKAEKFSKNIEQYNEVMKMQGVNINDEMSEMIRQDVWDKTISEKVIADECEELGMTITENEFQDIMTGDHISPILYNARLFLNEKGEFDVNRLNQFISIINNEEGAKNIPADQINSLKKYLEFFEHMAKSYRLEEKYNNLISKSIVINPLEAKYFYENSKISADVVVAKKEYLSISDSTISVSDEEIENMYKEKKNRFKQKENVDIKYITASIVPSEEDFNLTEKKISEIKDEFTITDDIAAVVNRNSDFPYHGDNLTKEQIDEDFQEFAFNGKNGDVMGPILIGNTYKMARIIDNQIISPDSVNLSYIYISKDNADLSQQLADSIIAATNNGEKFSELAKQYAGGEIGWLSELGLNELVRSNGLDKKISELAFSTDANKTFQISKGKDIQLFYVNDRGFDVNKANIAIINKAVTASPKTLTNIYNKMKQYIVDNNTLETFIAGAENNGYIVFTAEHVDINATKINNIKKTREVVKWAFKTEEGIISDIFEVDDQILAAIVTKHREEGYSSVEDVKTTLLAEIRKDKKAESLLKDMNGKSISELANNGYEVDTINGVSFASDYVGSIGNEPALFARIANSEVDKESSPIKGNNCVFIFKNINKIVSDTPFDEKNEIKRLMELRNRNTNIFYTSIEALKDAAEIKDMRYKYY